LSYQLPVAGQLYVRGPSLQYVYGDAVDHRDPVRLELGILGRVKDSATLRRPNVQRRWPSSSATDVEHGWVD